MKTGPFVRVLFFVVLAAFGNCAAAQECSTEKVNDACTITIDRSYPITLPTIQMRPGNKVSVKILNGLPFETLSLDFQTGQAVPGTEQTAGFLTAALPNLKGLLIQQELSVSKPAAFKAQVEGLEATLSPTAKQYEQQMKILKQELDQDLASVQTFETDAAAVYNQLNEVLGVIPPGVLPNGPRPQSSLVATDFPLPWATTDYSRWRDWMLCELAGQSCPPADGPSIRGLLADGATLVAALAPCPTQPDTQLIACRIAALQKAIDGIPSAADRDALSLPLRQLNEEIAALNADSAAVANIDKDLTNYFSNISGSSLISPSSTLGDIIDPRNEKSQRNVQLKKFLGRQVTYAVNAVNEVGTSVASVPAPAQKKSIVTITVLYADPIFEVSTGAIFSTLADRSFANQTLVTQNPGSAPTQGNVVIAQTISRPTVVVFAGGNWRLGHDFLWPDQRRGAFYLTGTVGVNVNNTAAEFGVGPSVSRRSLMFSVLYDWGHDVRLTQGEYVGEIWCNESAATGSIPKCSGPPPSPSTEKYWRGVVAFGISVRVPSVFGGGGGSSGASGGGH